MNRTLRGFTLVEVMVALLIMAMMAALAWRGLDALLSTRDGAQRHLDQTTRLQAVVAQWERDLQSIQDCGIAALPPLSYDSSTLRLTRRRPDGMQVVAWSVRDGGLYRWEGPVVRSVAELEQGLQRAGQLQALPASEQTRALDGVSGWQLYYFINNAWSNALSTGTRIPPGVRMLLQFDESSGFAGPLTREIELTP